jgi:hypothetical protein
MNIELLGRQALSILKSRFELPTSGLLAGGSISNVVWELVSGNKAVINDLDIFVLNELKEYSKDYKPIFEYREENDNYREEYSELGFITETKNYYKITEASKEDGIINLIKYESNTIDPMIVIKSFDINCTQIGCSLEDNKFYWTEDFEEFLKNGNLKITNLRTPAHTAARIAKKKKDLNVNLDEFEFKLIQHVLIYPYKDILRVSFKQRFFNIYKENSSLLSKYFKIKRHLENEKFIKLKFDDNSKIWKLEPIELPKNLFPGVFNQLFVFNDKNLNNIFKSEQFLFYMRNVFGNENLSLIWSKLRWFFLDKDYVDSLPSKGDLEFLNRLSLHAPNTIENLKGYKISEQIEIVNKILDIYQEDPIIAISVLEKFRINKDIEIDEQTKLLMELAVRRKIVNDTDGKVSRILN